MYIGVYIYIHMYVYVYIYICIYMKGILVQGPMAICLAMFLCSSYPEPWNPGICH